jgi:hypothetical protein
MLFQYAVIEYHATTPEKCAYDAVRFPRFPLVSFHFVVRNRNLSGNCTSMSNFYQTPPVIEASVFSTVPRTLWSAKKTDWIPGELFTGRRAKKYDLTKQGSGITPPIFLEGPTTDTQGNLFVVDVGQGRILRCLIETGTWELMVDYDGEPNGLTLDREGRLLVADYKNGIVSIKLGSSLLYSSDTTLIQQWSRLT